MVARAARDPRRPAALEISATTPPRRDLAAAWPLVLALAASLALLLWHAQVYRFLTDDAFISFRYARNLARGHGLVFNPGFERVEGYTNFLWVLILAGLDRLGLAPERAATPLSMAMTIALWGVVVAFALRRSNEPGLAWRLLIPAFGLALTRSFAVWSSGGLETRCFELLAIAGLLRLVVEVERLERGVERRSLACWLLGLATLTRPDGLMIAACAFAAGGAYLLARRRESLPRFARRQLPFVALIAAHYLFRRLYYGDWLPNTYYAKFGGQMWWASGTRYLAAFALEYFVVLWIPPIVLGIQRHFGRGTAFFPLLVGAVVIPHALYVAAIGGDHFEYRPLDLYFPLAFLLIADGVAGAVAGRGRLATMAAALYLGVMALGLTLIPWESHRQFIHIYQHGFPGTQIDELPEARDYLAPERDPLLRLPGLKRIARRHRILVRWMTVRFVAIRQEEHRMFLATAIAEGQALGRLRARGLLPLDTYIATDCVGAIPYYSDLRTLDRLGLTDRHVAHSKPVREVMAHSKSATLDYARERGVDLWAVDPVHLIRPVGSIATLGATYNDYRLRRPYFAIDGGSEGDLVCELPRGLKATRERMPGAQITPLDSVFFRRYLDRFIHGCQDSLHAHPADLMAARGLGYALILAGDYVSARRVYQELSRTHPDLLEGHENLSLCDQILGLDAEALEAGRRAIQMARAAGDTATIRIVSARLPAALTP